MKTIEKELDAYFQSEGFIKDAAKDNVTWAKEKLKSEVILPTKPAKKDKLPLFTFQLTNGKPIKAESFERAREILENRKRNRHAPKNAEIVLDVEV